jgi:nicotinamidase-related amidase
LENLKFDKEITAVVVIDPYNDFISEGGKIWDRIKTIAEANNCVPNMQQVLDAARRAGVHIFYAMHRRYRPGDYDTWTYIVPIQKAARKSKAFEYGTWGGEFRAGFEPQPGDIVAQEHWCSSGFANTDLDLLLKKHGIHKLSGLLLTHVWRQRFGLRLSLAMKSRWSKMRPRIIRIERCTRLSRSIFRITLTPL